MGFIYLLLSVSTLLFWNLNPEVLCTSEACSIFMGLLGRSWYLWGALFYTIAGLLCLRYKRNKAVGIFLAVIALLHAGLIGYSWVVSGYLCSICWKFAVMGILLAVLYWILPFRKPPIACIGPVKALAVITLALFVANPQTAGNQFKHTSFPVAETSACYLHVSTPDGQDVCLDLREKPALIFAVWCPHCDEALQDIANETPQERPYLVVLGDGKVNDKLAANGLLGAEYYFIKTLPEGIHSVPSLIGEYRNKDDT